MKTVTHSDTHAGAFSIAAARCVLTAPPRPRPRPRPPVPAAASNQVILQKLKALVQLNETLKKNESEFKLNCKNQRTELQQMLKSLGEDGAEDDNEEIKRMREVERLWSGDVDRMQKLRNSLAKKNQEIQKIVRQIDEIPTRVSDDPLFHRSIDPPIPSHRLGLSVSPLPPLSSVVPSRRVASRFVRLSCYSTSVVSLSCTNWSRRN